MNNTYKRIKKLLDLKDKVEKVDGTEFKMSGVSKELYSAKIREEEFFIKGKLPHEVIATQTSAALMNYIVDGKPLKDCLNKYYKKQPKSRYCFIKKVDGDIPCEIRVFRYVYDKKHALEVVNRTIDWYQESVNNWLNSAEERLLEEQEKVEMYKKTLTLFKK